MNQLDIFTYKPKKSNQKVTPELVLAVVEAIKNNKKLSNKDLIEKLQISRRTYYRIKSGDYDHLLQKAVEESVDTFSLELTD